MVEGYDHSNEPPSNRTFGRGPVLDRNGDPFPSRETQRRWDREEDIKNEKTRKEKAHQKRLDDERYKKLLKTATDKRVVSTQGVEDKTPKKTIIVACYKCPCLDDYYNECKRYGRKKIKDVFAISEWCKLESK